MNMNKLSDWARITEGELRGEDISVAGLNIDTRKLERSQVYLAIRGDRFDGNDFVQTAREAGASAAIVERWSDCGIPEIKVRDGRKALGQLATTWRGLWGGRLVGITGSNGKTTVKELVAALLAQTAPVWKTQGNLNNDIGVPLSLLQLRPEHHYAVIEMGANHPGEIAYVARLAKPDVAIISNAGPAHLEGFGSVEGVAKAKGELVECLPEDGVAVLNADDPFYGYWRDCAGQRRIVSFGFSPEADVRAAPSSLKTSYRDGHFFTDFDLLIQGQRISVGIPLCGRHNVINALAAIAAALSLGVDYSTLTAGLQSVTPVAGRLQPLKGWRDVLLIHDAYNANPASLSAALEILSNLPGHAWVALGSLGELGADSDELHADIGRKIKEAGVVRLFATGPHVEHSVTAFGAGAIYCKNQTEMIERIKNDLEVPAVLLVKGSRSQQMERVIDALREQDEICC